MKGYSLLGVLACAGCAAGAVAPPQPPPTATVPSASAPDRQTPSLPPAPAAAAPADDPACTSVLHGSIASHTSGQGVPALTVGDGERLCVQIQHDMERITSARIVEKSSDAASTLVVSLAQDKLQIENPFTDLLLHYSLAPPPQSGRACPAHPGEEHVETLPKGTKQVVISDMRFKGRGTAGSELCM